VEVQQHIYRAYFVNGALNKRYQEKYILIHSIQKEEKMDFKKRHRTNTCGCPKPLSTTTTTTAAAAAERQRLYVSIIG
jgi:hypothetical protein